jgi:hypothetical protein
VPGDPLAFGNRRGVDFAESDPSSAERAMPALHKVLFDPIAHITLSGFEFPQGGQILGLKRAGLAVSILDNPVIQPVVGPVVGPDDKARHVKLSRELHRQLEYAVIAYACKTITITHPSDPVERPPTSLLAARDPVAAASR